MRSTISLVVAVVATVASFPLVAEEGNIAKPNLLLGQAVVGMPKAENQELRVLTATFKPGDRTVYHTHRHPVAVYVLEGAFTLELEGRAPIVVKAGEAMIEPPNVPMTGYNRSTSEPTRVVIFYVSDVGTPFLDLHH